MIRYHKLSAASQCLLLHDACQSDLVTADMHARLRADTTRPGCRSHDMCESSSFVAKASSACGDVLYRSMHHHREGCVLLQRCTISRKVRGSPRVQSQPLWRARIFKELDDAVDARHNDDLPERSKLQALSMCALHSVLGASPGIQLEALEQLLHRRHALGRRYDLLPATGTLHSSRCCRGSHLHCSADGRGAASMHALSSAMDCQRVTTDWMGRSQEALATAHPTYILVHQTRSENECPS
jgi:hypothetical protein